MRLHLAPALALVLAVPASAATFASGPLFTPLALSLGAHLECRVTNSGAKPVSVRGASGTNADGGAIEVNLSCEGAPLAPGATCFLNSSAGVPNGSVRLEVQGSTKNVRAVCKLENEAGNLETSEMR
jgi:hypothetical protein